VMDEGRLVEIDEPERLLATGSTFRQLWARHREGDDQVVAGGRA